MSLKSLIKKCETRSSDINPSDYLLNAIDEAMQNRSQRTGSNNYKPSSLSGCLRAIYYQRSEAPLDKNININPRYSDMAEAETDRHDRLQQLITEVDEDNNFELEWVSVPSYIKNRELNHLEIPNLLLGFGIKLFDTRYSLSFSVDGLIKIKGKYYLLEIKTEGSYKWQGRSQVSKRHYIQAYCYSLAFGIDEVLFIYENRDTMEKKSYVLEVTDKDRNKVVDKINKVEKYLSKTKLPPKESNCRFCYYKEICSEDININNYKNVT